MSASAGVRTYSCDQCGGELTFDIGVHQLKCPSCGAEKKLSFTDPTPIIERDLNGMLARLAAAKTAPLAPGHREFHCKSCAATIVFDGAVTADACAYCGAPIVDSEVHEASARINVDGLLPFLVVKEKAHENLRTWVKTRWFAPNAFKRQGVEGRFNGVYLPYWTFDAHTDNRYSGERGDYYYVTVGSGQNERRERRTRWTYVSGHFNRFFDDVLVCAANDNRLQLLRELEPWPLDKLIPYTPDALAGYHALTYDQSLEHGFSVGKSRMEREIERDTRERIGGDEQRISSLNSDFSGLTFKHLLLPVWMLAYRYHEKAYQVVVNATTGEVQGERPYSALKITFAVIVAAIIASVLVYFYNANN